MKTKQIRKDLKKLLIKSIKEVDGVEHIEPIHYGSIDGVKINRKYIIGFFIYDTYTVEYYKKNLVQFLLFDDINNKPIMQSKRYRTVKNKLETLLRQ